MKTLRGRKALITGAASGIGRALALGLAREGMHLYLLDINEAGLADVVAQVRSAGVEAVGKYCDVANPPQLAACLRDMLSQWGPLHLLVNNAGVGSYGATDRMTAEQWNRVLAINLLAPIQITRELLPTLLAQDEAHILNVCSMAGLVAFPKTAAYTVSKFGLQGLSESLRAEYGRTNLGVTSLCPGFVDTNIFRAANDGLSAQKVRAPSARAMITPERVAAAAIRAIRRNRPLAVVTPLARALWLLKRMAPSLFLKMFCRKPPKSLKVELQSAPPIDRRASA
jgi:3-oxoacyl-[acyl-carrier protein] reductase